MLAALEIVATKEKLAAAIGIPVAELEDYLSGAKALPHQAFLTALDIVAKGR